MTFPRHNPAHQTFEYFCSLSGATDSQRADAATLLRDHVRNIRNLYKQPVGGTFPYHDPYFQLAYLVAYFPYYIEPVCHVLSDANLPDDLFARGELKASFIGGGPGPEVLGFAAYLRAKAPELKNVQVNIFDREPTWKYAQQILLPEMLKDYAADSTNFNISSRQFNVVECAAGDSACEVGGSDLIIAQNFLTEVYKDRAQAVKTFEMLVRLSGCRYLILVENTYPETVELMNAIARHLHARGLTKKPVQARTNTIRPNVVLPDVLSKHLYDDETRLFARKNVNYHYVVIEIER